MADILLLTFSNAFSEINLFQIWLKCIHLVTLTISQHWFRFMVLCWTSDVPLPEPMMILYASSGFSELTVMHYLITVAGCWRAGPSGCLKGGWSDLWWHVLITGPVSLISAGNSELLPNLRIPPDIGRADVLLLALVSPLLRLGLHACSHHWKEASSGTHHQGNLCSSCSVHLRNLVAGCLHDLPFWRITAALAW